MFGGILKATNSSFKKGVIFWNSVYVNKVMKLLAFIFELPSYLQNAINFILTTLRQIVSSNVYLLFFFQVSLRVGISPSALLLPRN